MGAATINLMALISKILSCLIRMASEIIVYQEIVVV